MLARRAWRRSKSAEPTSPRGNTNGSGNSRADAFLITAPLSHTPKSTLGSTNTSRSLALPRLWLTYDKGRVYSVRKVIVILRPGSFLDGLLPCCRVKNVFTTLFFLYVCSHPTLWRPEYGSYMIEGTPGQPYGGTMSEFNTVEGNMGKRRREASSVLNQNETLCTITSFPRYSAFTLSKCLISLIEEIRTEQKQTRPIVW